MHLNKRRAETFVGESARAPFVQLLALQRPAQSLGADRSATTPWDERDHGPSSGIRCKTNGCGQQADATRRIKQRAVNSAYTRMRKERDRAERVIAATAARAERAEDLHARRPFITRGEQCKLRIRCILVVW